MKNLKDIKTLLLFRTSHALDVLTKTAIEGVNQFLRVTTRLQDHVDDALTAPENKEEPATIPLVLKPEDVPQPVAGPPASSTAFPRIITSDQFYSTIREECMVVEAIIRKRIHALCEAVGINPVSLPVIIICPSTYVFEGIQPEPGGACVRVNDEGIVTQIRVAGIRLEGMTVEDENGDEVFGFFQKGSEAYERALLESIAVQLVHILHDDTRTPDMAWEAAERVAYRVAADAVCKVLGPAPEGWGMVAFMDDEDSFGDN